MPRSLYKNLRISSFVQCCYENYSAMQSNKRFNYSLVVPLLLLIWCVVLWRPGEIIEAYGWSTALSWHSSLFFPPLVFMCATVVFPWGGKVQQGEISSGWPWHKDFAREEDISWWSGKSILTRSPATRCSTRVRPLKKICFEVRFNLSNLGSTGHMWPWI